VLNIFEVEGVVRNAITDIPADYNAVVPTPLVIAFHGRTNSNATVRGYYDLDRYAGDAIVVYPS
jgi:polyhydroxybutyrate depolymerase